MIHRLVAFIVLLTAFAFSAGAQEKEVPKKPAEQDRPTSRRDRQIEGWTVRVDERLFEASNEALGDRALRFLENKLFDIKIVVPTDRLKKLQAVTIVLDLNHGKLSAMQYHPSAGWLKSNGYAAELAKCVHLPRAADVATRRNINEQPWVILHELAHAYHDQVLGFNEPRIREVFETFKKSGRGDKTLLYNGNRVKHYALTNPMEFFAEMTESFFGVNDFYPFNRAELKEAEPEIYALLAQIWDMPAARKAKAGDDVFQTSKVWPVHLTFTPKEYAALSPPEGGFLKWLLGKPKAKSEEPPRVMHRNNFGIDLPWVTGTIALGEETLRDVGIRYKGNGTFSDAEKTIAKSFKIDLDHFGGKELFHGAKTINLHSGVADPSRCRESLGYGTYRMAGVPAPRTALAEVWLTVPGKFNKEPLGSYTIIEHVDKKFLRDHFGSDRGLLMKPEGVDNLSFLGDTWDAYKSKYNPKREATTDEAKRIIAFTRLVSKADDAEFRAQIASYVDIDAYLRFLAATAYVSNPDSFFALGHNYFLYLHPKTGQFHFMPWDLDRAFANFPIFGSHEQQMDLSFRRPYFGSHKLNERLLAMPEVSDRYQKLLAELAATSFAKDRVLKELTAIEDATKEPIANGKKASTARRERVSLPFEPPPALRTFVEKRSESLAKQVAGTSTGHVPAGLIHLLFGQKKGRVSEKSEEPKKPD